MSWKFWKKEDDLGLDSFKDFGKTDLAMKDTGLDLSQHYEPAQFGAQQFSAPQQQTFQQAYPVNPSPAYPPPGVPAEDDHTQQHIQKDLEVIAAKLDTIRAQLEMLNTRLANLESKEGGPPKRPWY